LLESARQECETLLKIGNNQVKWLGIFAGFLSMLQIVCGTGIMIGQSTGLDDKMTIAIAASGIFIKAIESHFQLSNELVKVKNAMKMLSELDHDVKALGASPSKGKVDEFRGKFNTQMKKVKGDLM